MKTSVLTAATRGVDAFRRPQEPARQLTCCPLQRVAFSLPPSSLIGEALHDSVLNFLKRHVGNCEPDELEDGSRADCQHFWVRLWRGPFDRNHDDGSVRHWLVVIQRRSRISPRGELK